jgi:hypothetical protein
MVYDRLVHEEVHLWLYVKETLLWVDVAENRNFHTPFRENRHVDLNKFCSTVQAFLLGHRQMDGQRLRVQRPPI